MLTLFNLFKKRKTETTEERQSPIKKRTNLLKNAFFWIKLPTGTLMSIRISETYKRIYYVSDELGQERQPFIKKEHNHETNKVNIIAKSKHLIPETVCEKLHLIRLKDETQFGGSFFVKKYMLHKDFMNMDRVTDSPGRLQAFEDLIRNLNGETVKQEIPAADSESQVFTAQATSSS